MNNNCGNCCNNCRGNLCASKIPMFKNLNDEELLEIDTILRCFRNILKHLFTLTRRFYYCYVIRVYKINFYK